MTATQRKRIAELRAENYPYSFIGKALDLSPNTVKSICRRKSYMAQGKRKTKAEKAKISICKNCYQVFTPERRSRQHFCSETCRRAWWQAHRKVTIKST